MNNRHRDSGLLRVQLGHGSKTSEWHRIRLFVQNPGKPISDFLWLGSELVSSERARSLVGPSIDKHGEWLPVSIDGVAGDYYIYNSTTVIDVLNPKLSIWEFFKETGTSNIAAPAFFGKRLGQQWVFKYPMEGLVGLHVLERTGCARDNEFKALIENFGLTGIDFRVLWSDAGGPAIPKRIWGPEDPFEYRRHDGTPWVFEKPKPPSKKANAKSVKTAWPSSKKQKRTSK